VAKVIQFRTKPQAVRLGPRQRDGACDKCKHKMNVHVTHPDGSMSCAARGCGCQSKAPH
jgi:hypothetical protein